jgi:glycosyltransferase involved in cell wall biosynthesis
MRIVIATTHPIQYQAPLFRELAKILDLTVVFMMRQTPDGQAEAGFGVKFDWDVPLLEGYRFEFARNIATRPSTTRRKGIILAGHEELLDSLRPEALMLMGWFPHCFLQVMKWARRRRIPLVCRGESNLVSGHSLSKRVVKTFYFRWLFSQFAAFSVIGRQNAEFYRHYGVPEHKLHAAPYSVNTEFFEGEFQRHRSKQRRPGPWRLGFSGKLIAKKRPIDFLLAGRTCSSRNRIRLIFIGDGPLRKELEACGARENIDVEFRGFLNQSEIVAKGYADLDALVLPSGEYETWGLVVNEAMTGGIPAIVSDMVGCAPDLVVSDCTGYVFRSGDTTDLSRAIDCLVARLDSGHDFSPAVRERMMSYSLNRTALGVEQAMRAAARRTE